MPGFSGLKTRLASQSPVLPIVSEREPALLLLFSDYNCRYTPVHHSTELRVECLLPTDVEGRSA